MRTAINASIVFILTSLAAVGVAREPSAPLSAYGRLPFLEELAISPDGKRMAFVKTTDDDRVLIVTDLFGDARASGLRVGKSKLREVQWQDDDTIILTVSSTSLPPFGFIGNMHEWFQLLSFSVSKKKLKSINFEIEGERTLNVVVGGLQFREIDNKTMLFAPGLYVGANRTLPALFMYSPELHGKVIARGGEPNTQWIIDKAGRVAADLVYEDERKTWELRTRRDSRLVPAAKGQALIDTPDLVGFSNDGESVIASFVVNGDAVWRPVSLKDGAMGAPLDDGKFLHGYFSNRLDGRIIGALQGVEERNYVFFDNELQAHWNAVLRAFPNERVRLINASDDWSKIIVQVFGEKSGYQYALFDWYTHETTRLGLVYREITAPAEVREIAYAAGDGLSIPALLTLPKGADPHNLPLVVLPHGGPAAADVRGFDWWAQAIADQGYAVLQPNFRGSSLDSHFMEAGYGEFGRKMQSDLSDGVKYLARDGIIDPKRVCIVGASYGGYAALAGVTLQSGIYRCAVAVAGIGDVARMRNWWRDGHTADVSRYWDRFLGLAEHDDKAAAEISPIEHLEAVSAPILLIHGKDDTVVPYAQSDTMESALKRAHKNVRLVTLKHEDHWLSRSETRLQMLQETVDFLKANNPPD